MFLVGSSLVRPVKSLCSCLNVLLIRLHILQCAASLRAAIFSVGKIEQSIAQSLCQPPAVPHAPNAVDYVSA